MSEVMSVAGIFKSYGAIPVLRDISLAVEDKETLAIIGPNGAGKTTLVKTLTCEILPARGLALIPIRRRRPTDG